MISLGAKKVGDWARADRVLTGLITTVPEMVVVTGIEARRSANRVKRKIESQAYDWVPLHPDTVARKSKEGLDGRTLIATGSYLDAIEAIPMGVFAWGVGVRDGAKNAKGESLAAIGAAHEYGIGNVPPRPHWRREVMVFKGQLSRNLGLVLKRKVSLR